MAEKECPKKDIRDIEEKYENVRPWELKEKVKC